MNISRRIKCAEHTTHIGEMRKAYKILGGKPEEKISLEKPSSRWN
jgi:hypothetical protein